MTAVTPFPTRPSPRQAAFDREIERFVALGIADALGLDATVPDSWLDAQAALDRAARDLHRSPEPTTLPLVTTTALAITRVLADLSLSGQRHLLSVAEKLADAEHVGQSVLQVHVVTAVATDEARA